MWAKHKQAGFTIVELLIVIVVIGILGAITVVAYGGIQARARDVIRTNDVAKIRQALEAYKTVNSKYPPTNPTSSAATPTGTLPSASGYGYSVATDDSWLKGLVDGGFMFSPPRDPINDNNHYYRYIYAPAGGYGCDPAFGGFYMIEAIGYENVANVPHSVFAAERRCPTAPWYSYTGALRTDFYGWEN